jgi:hypothetical protein
MKIVFIKHTTWYRGGVERQEFAAGPDAVEVDEDLGAVALAEGWAVAEGAEQKEPEKEEPEQTADEHAPENKDAAGKRAKKA